MPEISPLTWAVGIAALVIGILAGHFGWGKRWPRIASKLHPDYLTGLDFLVTEQPDRALDVFLRLMDANSDTIETHFSLGSLYRRRGEVERAIRIHQNLLDRAALAPEHREQALLALAQDYLRAGLLDRAEVLLQRVSEVPRLRIDALESLRGLYERQRDWHQALSVYRLLAPTKAAPSRRVAAHYLCELADASIERGDTDGARQLLREARREASQPPAVGFARAALLRARIAEDDGNTGLAGRLVRAALADAPDLIEEELPHLLRLTAPRARDALLGELADQARVRGMDAEKRLVFAALAGQLADAAPLQPLIASVLSRHPALQGAMAPEIGALLAQAEKYRCVECGFAGRSFYWQCPACQEWDSFEPSAIVKLG